MTGVVKFAAEVDNDKVEKYIFKLMVNEKVKYKFEFALNIFKMHINMCKIAWFEIVFFVLNWIS